MMVIHDFQIAMHLLPSTLCNTGYIAVNPEFVTLLFVTQKNCHPVITFDFNN